MRIISTISGLFAAGALVASAGCLQKQVTHTLYLSPGGDVTWSAMEMRVRSDEPDASKRTAEENNYVASVVAGQHSVAAALTSLGGHPIATTWLRRERPYTVLTDARFGNIRDLAEAITRGTGLTGDATLAASGRRTTLTVRVSVNDAEVSGRETTTDALIEELERYRIVMTEGRFVFADGFLLDEDGVVAAPDQRKEPRDGVLTLVLAWIGTD
jgi:hypothetical protein